MESQPDQIGDRLSDMIGGLRKRGKSNAPAAAPPTLGEKALERPEEAQEAGRAFRAMRDGLGWSILDASAFLRVPPRTLYAWEDGTMQVNPTAWILLQVITKYPGVRKWVTPESAAVAPQFRPKGGR